MVKKTKLAPVALAATIAATNPALANEAIDITKVDTSRKVNSSLSVTPNSNGLDVTRTTENSMVNFSLESLSDSPIVGINAGIYKGQKGAFIDVKKGENITSVFATGTFNGENISSQATIGKMQKDFEGKNIGQTFFGTEVSLEVTDNLAVGAYANKTNTESKDLKSWTETKKVTGGTEITTYNERFNGHGKEAVGANITYTPNDRNRIDLNFGQAETDKKYSEFGVEYNYLTEDLKKKIGAKYTGNNSGDYYSEINFGKKIGKQSEIGAFVGTEKFNGEKDNFVGVSYTFNFDGGNGKYSNFSVSKDTYNPYSHVIGADEASKHLYGEKQIYKSVKFIPDPILNNAPKLNITNPNEALVGQNFSYKIDANDLDNDVLTYEAIGLPKGLKLNGNVIEGKVEEATDINGKAVIIIVKDGKGGVDEKTIFIKFFIAKIIGIPFETEEIQDPTLNQGERKIVQNGLAGIKNVIYDKNGTVVREIVTSNPVKEIVHVGTKTTNNIPTFLTSGEFKTKVGENFSLEIKAEDRDNDTLTYNFSNLPTWLNASGNKLSGTPDKSGKYTFTVEVNDEKGGIVSKEFSVDVEAEITTITPITSINNIPEITIKGNTSGKVGESFNLDVEVTDKEDNFDLLTILAEGLPAGLNFDKTIISGTPSVSGKYSVKIIAIDTKGAKREKTVVLNIAEKPNNAPIILTAGSLEGKVGEAYSLIVNTTDVDNDNVTVKVEGLPAGLTFSGDRISGTPTTAGKYPIKIIASDGKLDTVKMETINIAEKPNTAPVITTTGSLEGKVGENYTLTINSTDSDNDNVTLRVEGLPAGLTFSGDRISGTPTTAGTYQIKITATDGITETVENKTITIAEKVNVNSLPEITTTGSLNGKVFENYSLTVNATDNEDGDNVEISVNNLPAGLTFSRNKISGTPKKHGNYSVEIIATDKNGGQTKKTIEINIEAPEKITENPVPDVIELTYRGSYSFPELRDSKGIRYKTEGLTGFTEAGKYGIYDMDDVGTFNIKVTLIDEYYGTEITKNVTLISKTITHAPYHIEAKVGDIIELKPYGAAVLRIKIVPYMKEVEGGNFEFEAVKPGVYELEYYGITKKGYGRKGGDIHTIAKAIITITE